MKYKKLKTIWKAIKDQTGYNEAQVEHALDLDQGTIKMMLSIERISGKCLPETMALFKIIHTYPWMLKVADSSYDEKCAEKEMLKQAADIIVDAMYPPNKRS